MHHVAPAWVPRLVDSLVEQVVVVLPSTVTLTVAKDGWPRVTLKAKTPGRATFDFALLMDHGHDETERQGVAAVVTTFLDFVQDFLVLATRAPWPGAGTDLPIPHVLVRGDSLEGWFGEDPDAPNAVRISVSRDGLPDEAA